MRDRGVWLGALSDPELIERYRLGDDRAFAVLYEKYRRLWGSRAYKILRDFHLAEDAVHDALAYASRVLRTTEHEVRSFRAWSSILVRNRATDIRRRRSVQPDLFASTLGIGEPSRGGPELLSQVADWRIDLEAECHATLAMEQVSEAAKVLYPSERKVVELCVIEGLSHEEAAKTLVVSPASVRATKNRSLRRLRPQLAVLR